MGVKKVTLQLQAESAAAQIITDPNSVILEINLSWIPRDFDSNNQPSPFGLRFFMADSLGVSPAGINITLPAGGSYNWRNQNAHNFYTTDSINLGSLKLPASYAKPDGFITGAFTVLMVTDAPASLGNPTPSPYRVGVLVEIEYYSFAT